MNFRKEYTKAELLEDEVCLDPLAQFERWFAEYLALKPLEPYAMILATASLDGVPSLRTVLLRDHLADGFVFYTNYQSQKGSQLEANPRAALLFYWPELERQVQIVGRVEKLPSEESKSYFQTRPRGSQLGAVASPQSRQVNGREDLITRFKEAELKFGEGPIPCPAHWGGYKVLPESFEFWQGRENRMHDRILYKVKDAGWSISRLAP